MLRSLGSVFLIVVVVEGAIRKWLVPEFSNAAFLLKDVVLIAAFAAYLAERRRSPQVSRDAAIWLLWALLVVGYSAAEKFSFESIVGLRYYLAPLPLILLVPALIRNSEDLERLATWGVRISIPIGILAVVQYLSPVDSPLNTYAWSGEEGASFGVEGRLGEVRPRVTATFSYISTYASFLSAVWLLAWILLLRGRHNVDRWIAAGALILTAFNMGMNGSRALLVFAVLTGFPFALAYLRHLGSLRGQVVVGALITAIAVTGVGVFEPFALTTERGGMEEASERISAVLLVPGTTLATVDLVGEGIGSTFGGFEQLGHRAMGPGWDEINLDRIGIEVGVFGYLMVLALKILMVVKTFRVYLRLPAGELRNWAVAALLIQLSNGWQIPFYNAVAAVFYFSAIGLIYWLDGEGRRIRLEAMRRPLNEEPRQGHAMARGWR